MNSPGVVCFTETLHTPVPPYQSPRRDLWITKPSWAVWCHTVASIMACKYLLCSHIYCGFHWLGSKCGTWPVESSRYTSIQRSFLFHVSIFNMLTLFCSIFCSWFCFPWISIAEMKCQCAGIIAEKAWCAIVLHIKSFIELCRACHALLSPAVFPSVPPILPFPCCFKLPANRFSLYPSPLYHCLCWNGHIH